MAEWNGRERRRQASLAETVAAQTVQVDGLRHDLQTFIKTADERYVTKDRFVPVERVVYGIVAAILLGFVGAIGVLVF